MTTSNDPFAQFKAAQREAWSLFLPLEVFTTMPAAKLVKFARVKRGDAVLDVACGTGVVSVTAARLGAEVRGLDLSPVLVERAKENAKIAGVDISFVAGDAEALPFESATFDVVLSQFGHMFAPRPEVAVAEMLRVLKPGGRIAFSTWPEELFTGRLFAVIGKYMPRPPEGAAVPAPPPRWGHPDVVRERLGAAVVDLAFERDVMTTPSLGPAHSRHMLETTLGPLVKLVAALQGEPARLAQLRAELDALLGDIWEENRLKQDFLMSRATKR